MEAKVHFELLDQPDRVEGIARLLLRRGRLRPHILVLCPDTDFQNRLDERLWTIHPESFLAHGVNRGNTEDNMLHPILLSQSVIRDNSPEALINGGLEVPPNVEDFVHIVDFVDGWDEHLKQMARERFRTYREMGFEPEYLNASSRRS